MHPITPPDAGAQLTSATALRAPRSIVEPRTTEEFEVEIVDLFNKSALALMISVGHRTGLFENLRGANPRTSQQIADDAGLEERYVREWLAGLVTSRVIAFDPDRDLYWLPDSHAELLTGGVGNAAAQMQWFAVLAGAEDGVVDAFRHGGGVHYHCFHRFHEVMSVESEQTVVSALEEHILPLAPGLIDSLERGIEVLDVGCGSGFALVELAKRFPKSRFLGYDLCEEAIDRARARATERDAHNVHFGVRDVTTLNADDQYDLITAFDAIHDQKDPKRVLSEIVRALKPHGLFLAQDIAASSHLEKNMDHLLGPFLYTISTMHCMTVSLAQGGDGLGTCWGEELAVEMFQDAGFSDVEVHKLPHDVQNNYYLCRREVTALSEHGR